MSVQGDQMVYAYLSRLSEVAHGSLPTLERARLVEQIRRCIDAQRQPGARDDADRVGRILDRMGEPAVIVDEAARRLGPDDPGPRPATVPPAPNGQHNGSHNGRRKGRSDGELDSRQDGRRSGELTQRAGEQPPAEAVKPARDPFVDTADLPFRVTEPVPDDPEPLVLATDPLAETEPDLLNVLGDRRRELVALLALSAGTLLLSYLGLMVGGVLVGTSKAWALRDKVLTLLGLPVLTLFGGIVLTWLQVTRLAPAVETGDRLEQAGEWLWRTFLTLPVAVGWVAALFLGVQLLRTMRD